MTGPRSGGGRARAGAPLSETTGFGGAAAAIAGAGRSDG
jgi:hypothetical protein